MMLDSLNFCQTKLFIFMKAYLGIDVSKGYADFALLDAQKNPLEKVFQLDDTRRGHDCLKDQIKRLMKKHGVSLWYCGLESTGGFENNWYGSLLEWGRSMPLHVARLNPSGVKKSKEADLSRNVTDELSAVYIAKYLISYPEAVTYDVQDAKYSSYRSLHKHINLQKKQKTQLINQLKMMLYSAFPELIRYCKDSIPYWVLGVLRQHQLPKNVAALDPGELARIPHVSLDKAKTLIAKAKGSVASRGDETSGLLIKSLAEQILEKQRLIEEHKKYLTKACKGPEVDLVKSIVGIGDYSAAAIMIEIEDVRRFPSPKNLVSYFGVHPELKESGDKKLKPHMSKRGRSSMRGILYMCANAAVLHDGHMKHIYHEHRKSGMGHKQALGVIMQKLLRIIWGVLSTRTKYDPAIDSTNQENSKKNKKGNETKAVKRRFQEQDREAPVSHRQSKTRRALKESQVPESETNTGSSLNAPVQI
jgi:transposase